MSQQTCAATTMTTMNRITRCTRSMVGWDDATSVFCPTQSTTVPAHNLLSLLSHAVTSRQRHEWLELGT